MITGDLALQPGCDAEPRFRAVRYDTGGLQPTLAVRRLSSATTPGVERDELTMRVRGCAGISRTANAPHMVNFPRCSLSPFLRGEGRGEGQRHTPASSERLPLTLALSPQRGGERELKLPWPPARRPPRARSACACC